VPYQSDPADDLRREIASHLDELAEAESSGGAPFNDAVERTQRRFGDAVSHFEAGLMALEGRQRRMRQTLIALSALSVSITAIGVVVLALMVRDVQHRFEDFVSASTAEPVKPVGVLHMAGLVVVLNSSTGSHPGWSEVLVSRSWLESTMANLGIACPDGQYPALAIRASDPAWSAFGFGPSADIEWSVSRAQLLSWTPPVQRNTSFEELLGRALEVEQRQSGGIRRLECRPAPPDRTGR